MNWLSEQKFFFLISSKTKRKTAWKLAVEFKKQTTDADDFNQFDQPTKNDVRKSIKNCRQHLRRGGEGRGGEGHWNSSSVSESYCQTLETKFESHLRISKILNCVSCICLLPRIVPNFKPRSASFLLFFF